MIRLIQAAALALVVVASGCRPGPGPSLVQFTRTGGIASLDETLDVRESGGMTVSMRRGGTKMGVASNEELERLRALFNSPEFAGLPGEVRRKGFDVITYTIRAETKQGRKTVITADGVEQPKVLGDVLFELQRLEEKCK